MEPENLIDDAIRATENPLKVLKTFYSSEEVIFPVKSYIHSSIVNITQNILIDFADSSDKFFFRIKECKRT